DPSIVISCFPPSSASTLRTGDRFQWLSPDNSPGASARPLTQATEDTLGCSESRRCDGFQFEDRSIGHVGGRVDQPIRPLVDVTNPLAEFCEHRFAAHFQSLAVELNARELHAGERSGDKVPPPLWELVARVEDHARNGDGRFVVRDRLHHPILRGRRLYVRWRQTRFLAFRI